MSQQKSFNVAPYFDDFLEEKDFHQVLFKPGQSVQARELTQLQTILRDQIKKFGDHVFQQGSVVIPGNSFYDLNTPTIKLDAEYLGVPISIAQFNDQTIVGATSGVEAVVRAVVGPEATDPNTLFVNYISGGFDGVATFFDGEDLYVKSNISVRAKIKITDAFATGSLAFVNPGVYYVNGTFARVGKQTTILSKYTQTPSVHVLLKIEQSIVDADDDQSLLDPAQGSPNYAAPGADRLRVSLSLTTLPVGSAFGDDYVELIRLEDGVLLYHSHTPKYSELEKSLARRTYDESGDYLVTGFTPSILEHLKVEQNRGVYPLPEGDNNKFVLNLTAGKSYLRGFEKEIIYDVKVSADKGRTLDHIKTKETSIIPSFGQVIYVTNLVKLPNISTAQSITFYNDNDPLEPAATQVGSAKSYAIEYKEGAGIYALYFYDAVFTPGFGFDDVGGIRYATGGSATVLQRLLVPNASGEYTIGEVVMSGTRTAVVKYHDTSASTLYVYKNNHSQASPVVGDYIMGVSSSVASTIKEKYVIDGRGNSEAPIVKIPLAPLATLRNSAGVSDISYRVYLRTQILTDAAGNGSVVFNNGKIDVINSSTVVAAYSGGVLSVGAFSLSSGGTTLVITGGPASVTIDVQVLLTKTATQERTKTLTTHVQPGLSLTGGAVQLDKADIYNLVSVISSTMGNVTDRFRLDNGQKNYGYGLGSAVLTGVAPTGSLTVTYQYFEHSPSGDYFSIDSYRNSGVATPTDLDFLDFVPSYYSTNDTKIYDLKNHLDFRRIVGTSGVSLVNNQQIVTSVGFYVGRIDSYGMDSSGSIQYDRGIPEEIPSAPAAPSNTLTMGYIHVPAWTENVSDIKVKEEKIRRFTMRDINKLNERVNNLENYSTLNALEADAAAMDIVDAKTGLSRFKTGMLVDNFTNPDVISDFYNPQFSTEYEDGVLKPAKQWVQAPFEFIETQSTNFRLTGDVVTLPYTEVDFVQQPFSTKITNVNPFLVISWIGDMRLNPAVDSWIEKEDLPTIYNTINNEVIIRRTEIVAVPRIVNVTVSVPWNSPIPPITPAVSVTTW